MSENRLLTSHQLHAASPPLLDLLDSNMPRLHKTEVFAEPATALTAKQPCGLILSLEIAKIGQAHVSVASTHQVKLPCGTDAYKNVKTK